jgi:hypothetical protein
MDNGKGKMMGIKRAVSKSGHYPFSIIHVPFPRRGNAPETALISTTAFLRKAKKEGPSVDGFPFFYGLRFAPGPELPSRSDSGRKTLLANQVGEVSPSLRSCALRYPLCGARPRSAPGNKDD